MLLESLGRALSVFTTAHFGREGTLDEGALDESLGTAREVLSRAKLEQLWVMKRFAAYRAPAPMDTRVWSR